MNFYRVRICVGNGMLHLICLGEPEVSRKDGKISHVKWKLIEDTSFGDTLGFVDWTAVSAVSWRLMSSEDEDFLLDEINGTNES